MRARYARAADCQLKQACAVFFLATEGAYPSTTVGGFYISMWLGFYLFEINDIFFLA
jgi:uncharacterized circularly permuted ATP-grasp superfamily protein